MTKSTLSACKGRERSCMQCGNEYRSIRSTSRYCSAPCRKRAGRGKAPEGGPRAGPRNFSPITKALHIAGYVGRTAPVDPRSSGSPVYSLLVDEDTAHAELAHQFDRKGWGIVDRDEFTAALKADGIRAFHTRSPEAAEMKLRRDRRRQRLSRAS